MGRLVLRMTASKAREAGIPIDSLKRWRKKLRMGLPIKVNSSNRSKLSIAQTTNPIRGQGQLLDEGFDNRVSTNL